MLTPANQHVSLKLIGTVDEEFGILQDLTIALPLARSAFGQREDAFDFVAYAPGADNAQRAAGGRPPAREPASRRRARARPRSSRKTRPSRSTRCWR